MRLRNDPKASEYLENSKLVLKEFPIVLDNNTVIEIGMGKGEMICEMSKLNPNKKFIGIEKFPTVAMKAAKRAEKDNINNLLIICEDVEKLEDQFINNVDEIWLTFSDPWPKKRHFKRRLTYKRFLDIYKKLLSNTGVLKIKTDNDKFFEWSKESIIDYGANIIFETNDLHNSIKNDSNVKTGYEIKWSEKGKNINYMEITFN